MCAYCHILNMYTHILIAGTEFPLRMTLCFEKDLIIYLWLERLALEERIFRDKEKKKELNDPLGEIFKKFGDKE